MSWLRQLRLRPRLLAGAALGAALALLWPAELAWQTRLLLGWSLGVWIYIGLILHMMGRTPAQRVQDHARALADGVRTVLLLAMWGALASLAAIALELAQVRASGLAHGWPHLLLVLGTVAGSWLLLPIEFALAYASLFHSGPRAPHGLEFPGDRAEQSQPDYLDFLYFAITLAATSQTSDVTVSARPMRRLVLVQALLSFVFNTVVLALSINLLAGLAG